MTKPRHSIAYLWQGFVDNALPESAPAVQLREMRKAFYCGAYALFTAVLVELDEGTDEVTDADMAYLDSLDAELKTFFKEPIE